MAGVATCLIDGRTVVAHPGDASSRRRRGAPDHQQHDEDLVIVEVQRGAYTGEDDIVRLEDDYGRIRSAG